MVGSADSLHLRRALLDKLLRDGHLRSPRIAEAFAVVPRELFVPDVPLQEVYRSNEAIVVKRIDGVGVSSASAPDVVALMLEQLDAQPGDRVLEIGAGTGYNAALLGHIVGETGRVVTLDIDDDIVSAARLHLASVGATNVEVLQTDGALGYPGAGLFDRIILTVASRDIAPAWRDQLTPETGRLVMPLVLRGPQRCVAFVHATECLISEGLRGCGFMPLRGLLATEPLQVPLNQDGNLAITQRAEEGPMLSIQAVAAALSAAPVHVPTGVVPHHDRIRDGLELWLAVHDRAACTLWSAPGDESLLPQLFGTDRYRATLGLVDATGVAVLAWGDPNVDELCVRAPESADALAQRLVDHVLKWQAFGQPSDAELRIRAYRSDVQRPARANEVVIEQRWTRFVLSWLATR